MSFSKWKQPRYAKHRAELERRGIPVRQADDNGYEPMTADETRRECGISADTIAVTCLRPDGTPYEDKRYVILDEAVRVALGRKRHQRKGSGVMVHVRRPKRPDKKFKDRVVITEGEFSADAIAYHCGATAVGVLGVTSVRQDGSLHPHIVAACKGKTVELAFDTDLHFKPQVLGPVLDLGEMVLAAGAARVQIRELQALPNLEKTGADDLIQHRGAQAYLDSTLHDFDSPLVRKWREQLGKTADTLPASLRNLRPVDKDWLRKEPPDCEYIVQPYVQTLENAIVVGAGGAGKSFWTLYMGIAVATGTPHFVAGTVPCKRGTAYLMLERHHNSFRRRFHKVAKHACANLQPGERAAFEQDLLTNFYPRALAGETLNLIEYRDGQWVVSATVDALIAELKAAGIEFLIIDPLSRLHGANENDSSVAATITRALERIVQEAGCSVLLIHHTGKNVRGDQYSGRGSSALNDNTSECIVISKLEPEERARLDLTGLGDDKDDDIIRVHHARCSDGAPAPDMLLAQSRKTGVLRYFVQHQKTPADIAKELLGSKDKVHQWAGGQSFTKTKFRNRRRDIFAIRVSERDAESVFDEAVTLGLFEPARGDDGKSLLGKGGYPLYQLSAQWGSETVVGRPTAPHPEEGKKGRRA